MKAERYIGFITLGLTVLALIIGVALPEVRTALGLERRAVNEPAANQSEINIQFPKPPAPPSMEQDDITKNLPKIEIKKDYDNNSAQTGEFIIYPGATFKNMGALKGKIIIQKGATFINSGAIEGDILNKGGTFKNNGVLDGALTVE